MPTLSTLLGRQKTPGDPPAQPCDDGDDIPTPSPSASGGPETSASRGLSARLRQVSSPIGGASDGQLTPRLASGGSEPSSLPNIGPREDLNSLASEFRFNPNFVQKVSSLGQRGYDGWRRIRGDGNCFYRAVGFGLLEHLVTAPHPGRASWADALGRSLGALRFEDEGEAAAHRELVESIDRVRRGGGWEAPTQADAETTALGLLYRSLKDAGRAMDLALVRALRRLAAQHLTRRADDATANGGISFDTVCHAQGYAGAEDFCNKVVLAVGVEAEGVVLQALPAALGFGLRVAVLDRAEGAGPAFCDYNVQSPGHVLEPKPVIHVQLRPGHYDLLYFGEGAALVPAGLENLEQQEDEPPRCRPPTLGLDDGHEFVVSKPREPRRWLRPGGWCL